MTTCYFITGTDTGVGKTTVTCELLKTLSAKTTLRVAGFKPIATGAHYSIRRQQLTNDDALKLAEASNIALSYNEVNPYCFKIATSPHIASHDANKPIDFSQISAVLAKLKKKADLILIEGAGGWHTPVSEKALFSDWVCEEKLPVILVVPLKLGCINHALLTQAAIKQAKLSLAGWVVNAISPQRSHDEAYLLTLTQAIHAPLLGKLPYQVANPTDSTTKDFDLDTLLDGVTLL